MRPAHQEVAIKTGKVKKMRIAGNEEEQEEGRSSSK
jgi:hypothetical protein